MKKQKLKARTTAEKSLQRALDSGYAVLVPTEEALLAEPFNAATGIIAHQRKLRGDFNGLAEHLYKKYAKDKYRLTFYGALNARQIEAEIPQLNGDIKQAAEAVLRDMRMFSKAGAIPALRIITDAGYKGHESMGMADSLQLFHIDSNLTKKGRFFCRYTGAETENLLPQDAVPRLLLPKYRGMLRGHYNKQVARGDEYFTSYKDFEHYLQRMTEEDAKYISRKYARPFGFNAGDIVKHNRTNVHRPRPMKKGEPLKMLLVCDFV